MAKFSECPLTLAVHCAATAGISMDDVNPVQEYWNIPPQLWTRVCVSVCVYVCVFSGSERGEVGGIQP